MIADDSPTSREALRSILHKAPDLRVVGEASDGVAVVEMVESLRPDVVLMKVHMPGANGLDATRQIMIRTPTPIVILTGVNTRDVDLSLTRRRPARFSRCPSRLRHPQWNTRRKRSSCARWCAPWPP